MGWGGARAPFAGEVRPAQIPHPLQTMPCGLQKVNYSIGGGGWRELLRCTVPTRDCFERPQTQPFVRFLRSQGERIEGTRVGRTREQVKQPASRNAEAQLHGQLWHSWGQSCHE